MVLSRPEIPNSLFRIHIDFGGFLRLPWPEADGPAIAEANNEEPVLADTDANSSNLEPINAM